MASEGRVSTGNASLDRRLEGGLRPGSVVAIQAPAASQSEALIHTLMQQRPSLYVSTVRRAAAVERAIGLVGGHTPAFSVREVGATSAATGSETVDEGAAARADGGDDRDVLEAVAAALEQVDEQANVVVDPVNPLERSGDPSRYRAVLNELKERVLATGGVGVLHCVTHGETPGLREATLTVADVVWELEFVSLSNKRKYHLTIPKNRGGKVVQEEIEIVLGRDLNIDDTRNI